MNRSYFYNILFFAFENLVRCEDKYELDLDKFSDFRKTIVSRVKENFDFLTRNREEEVKEKLANFIRINEDMTKEDEEEYLDIFLDKYEKMFGKKDNTIYLKEKVPYEDIAEVRFMIQEPIERNTISAIYREALSFEAIEALGSTSILNNVKKMVEIESNIENVYMSDYDNDTLSMINVGNYFVRSKLLNILKKGYNSVDSHYSNLLEMSSRNKNHDWITDIILSDKIRENSTLFLDNMYIDDEFSNIFQKAIFDKEPLVYKSLVNYFDDIWDYIYKDNKDAEDKVESILYDFIDEDEGEDYEYDSEEVDDKRVEKAKYLFYLSYIAKLDLLINNGCSDLNETKNRLLYALNYYDGSLKNKKCFDNVYSKLSREDFNKIDFHDFYVMSKIMLLDIVEYNNYENLLKKVLFISTYYELTHDYRINKILDRYQNPSLGIDLTNAIINQNYNVLLVIERTNEKSKKKEKKD